MHCYLCNSENLSTRRGKVRDAPHIGIVECAECGLVALNSTNHIDADFYENSGMHGADLIPMENWFKKTAWDDNRRFELLKATLPNKRLLDFGCGAGGFLKLAQQLAGEVVGIEVETRVQDYWAGRMKMEPSIGHLSGGGYDLITAFHVIEHLQDPRAMLHELAKLLVPGGQLIVEVPSSEDALLTLYDCNAFQNFTYWSQHLYLFNSHTLNLLARQAGLRVASIRHYQRYPLSNHLYWLSQGKPGGHQRWAFLDTPELTAAYSNALASHSKTDTLIAYLERGN